MPVLADNLGDLVTTNTNAELGIDFATQNSDRQLFDFYVNLLQSLLWQYNSAENLRGLIEAKQAWYDANQQGFWESFVTDVFNLTTANEFGLSVWSIILGLPLFFSSPTFESPIFGFGGVNGDVNFDNGILSDQNGTIYNLPLETKRLALRLRYFQLVSSGTVPETNRMLAYLFADFGNAYLIDYHSMNQAYIFMFAVPWDMAFIFNNLDILPRPSGVGSTWIDATKFYFGFGGSNGALNFGNGVLQ